MQIPIEITVALVVALILAIYEVKKSIDACLTELTEINKTLKKHDRETR